MKALSTNLKKRATRGATVLRDLSYQLDEALAKLKGTEWPSLKWKDDPVGFVREVLGEMPLPHQVEILEAARDNFKTAVRSGQKTGKTKLVVWLALWWYCTRPRARVFMVAAIKEQVGRVLWVELKATLRAGKVRGFELAEAIPANPANGVIAEDGREIRGFTVRDIEAMAGLSGEIFFIVDEASHLLDAIAQAIEGNLAGDGKMIWISNPTRTNGPFYDVFNNPDKGKYWAKFHLSSEVVADYQYTHKLSIPGVATKVRITEWAEEWGRDSPFFIVRVLGEFLRNETGRINSLGDIEMAQMGWVDAVEDEGARLSIGVDPSGPGDSGDEYAFSVVRGLKMIGLFVKPGMTEDAAVDFVRGLVSTYRRGNELPWVIVDIEGPIGSSLGGRLAGIANSLRRTRPAESYEFCGVKASSYARREPLMYERIREELWAGGAKWLKAGGTIISDHKLATELHAPMWTSTIGGKLKVTPKSELRDILGRSPDRADSFLLAVWEPTHYAKEDPAEEVVEYVGATPRQSAGGPMNPYSERGGGNRGGGFDPYS